MTEHLKYINKKWNTNTNTHTHTHTQRADNESGKYTTSRCELPVSDSYMYYETGNVGRDLRLLPTSMTLLFGVLNIFYIADAHKTYVIIE